MNSNRFAHATRRTVLALAAASAAAATGAPAPTVLEPVVITATRSEAAPFDVPASINRIDGEALRAGRAQVNISEGLGAVPGFRLDIRR